MPADRRLTVFTVLAIIQLASGDMIRNFVGWAAWGVTVGALIVWALVELWLRRREVKRPGVAIVMFTAMVFLSATWAASWPSTLLGAMISLGIVAAALVMTCQRLERLIELLHWCFQGLLAGSLAFEVVAGLWLGRVRPVWHGDIENSDVYWWTHGELFSGGRVYGLMGNANLLGMLALMALIIAAARAFAGHDRRTWPVWVVLSIAMIAGSQSVTVAATVAAIAASGALIVIRFRVSREAYYRAFWSSLSAIGIVVIIGAVLWQSIAEWMGRTPDLTGRLEFWRIVLVRWLYSPVVGDGWMGYWMPWVEPYGGLLRQGSIVFLQAHNVWLDIALQIGIVGVIIFLALQITAMRNAVALIRYGAEHAAVRSVPLLLLIALAVQGFTESRPLTEIGALLLFLFAAGEPRSREGGPRTLPLSVQSGDRGLLGFSSRPRRRGRANRVG